MSSATATAVKQIGSIAGRCLAHAVNEGPTSSDAATARRPQRARPPGSMSATSSGAAYWVA
jgi:hypothetical protein